jgi:hypothetical protein
MRSAVVKRVAFIATCLTWPTLATASDRDFVPGQERQVVYYSPWADCIGNPTTPICALETLFSCMVRGDRDMCRMVGVAADTRCHPTHVTGVRYVIERIDSLEMDSHVRILFHAQICRDDTACRMPTEVQIEELDMTEGKWRFRPRASGVFGPQVYEQACRPLSSATGLAARVWV